MRIDGRKVAERIRNQLKTEILNLKNRGIIPKIAIITLGPETSWETYVRQKIKVAGELGIKAVLITLSDVDEEELIRAVDKIDSDQKFHGIIVQRPIPESFSREKVINAISPQKDIDGFRDDSKFEVPVWLAVRRLIGESLNELNVQKAWQDLSFVVLGKGETAGGPIIRGLKNMGIEPQIIDSRTEGRNEILKNADIVISCVGKTGILNAQSIKKGSIIIGVGTHGEDFGEGTRLAGDYNEKEIEQVAGAYTPTPGGVGPVNLSYLFENLVSATSKSS